MSLNIRTRILLLPVLSLVFWGCPSQEYTSAKLYIQNEDWERAEEFLFKALEV